ncbi:MAG: GTP cyclohydrolase [Geminicoccaceae bacterium]
MRGAENATLIAFRAGFGGIEHVAIRIGEFDPRDKERARSAGCIRPVSPETFWVRCAATAATSCRVPSGGSPRKVPASFCISPRRGAGSACQQAARLSVAGRGLDTIEANEHLGFLADERDWLMPAIMLEQLGIRRIRLLTNNPAKVTMIQRHGIEVAERVPHAFAANPHNRAYLATKAERSGHFLGEEHTIPAHLDKGE